MQRNTLMSTSSEPRQSREINGAKGAAHGIAADANVSNPEVLTSNKAAASIGPIAHGQVELPRDKQSIPGGASDESSTGSKFDNLRLDATAARLCAKVFSNGKSNGRFSIPISNLRKVADLGRGEFQSILACAIRNRWLHVRGSRVELRAAGIYVAKEALHLPR